MRNKFISFLKWFFIILGVLFFVELLILIGTIIGITNFSKMNFSTKNSQKEIQPIINYAEKYRQEHNKYPENTQNIKIKKGFEYEYKASKDLNCYTITAKSNKNSQTKQYQHCKTTTDNSQSDSESYIEYKN